MLSFGVAAFTENGELADTFERNLETLPNAKQDADTMSWWLTQPEAWELCRKNLVEPLDAMYDFTEWVNNLCEKYDANPVFLAYPAGFDFTFLYVYFIHFTGKCPFSFSSLDIKSYAMAVMGTGFRETTKRNIPNRLKSKRKHTHEAIQDALGQGELFMKMLSENKRNLKILNAVKDAVNDLK